MDFTFINHPCDIDIIEIRQGLRAYNMPFLEGVDDQDLACFVHDEDGSKVGGVVDSKNASVCWRFYF